MFTLLLDLLIVITVSTPLVGLLGKRLGKEKKITSIYTTLGLLLAILAVLFYYSSFLSYVRTPILVSCFPSLEAAYFKISNASMFVALLFLVVGVTSTVFSYTELSSNSTGFHTILMALITGLIGLTLSGDLVTFFLFWEIMCLSSYSLVAFKRESAESIEASYKYLIMSSAGTVTILFAFSLIYGMTGTLNLLNLASVTGLNSNPTFNITLVMLIVGFGLQAAMFPFHTWLPDAHTAAPSSISAILSGVVVVAGILGLLKVLFLIFPSSYMMWSNILLVFSVFTMFIGNLSALLQDDIKRLLAYSTIANSGYILFGLAIGTENAITGSLFHVFNHGIVKALLFLCAGSIIYKTKKRSLKSLSGIRYSMPITSAILLIGLISLASIPPLNIFWSELMIIQAGIEAGKGIFSFIMIINMILSAAYCLRIIQAVAIKPATAFTKNMSKAPRSMLFATAILVVLAIVIGVYPSPFQNLSEIAASTFDKIIF
jgi:proton-translocating NADH-quinone oxidoreductase chain M